MKKTEEVQELQVLTEDQIKALPKEAIESVTYLTKTVGVSELTELNPLVTKLIELREKGAKLKMKPISPDGEFDKENIQSFIDVQGEIKTYRAKVKSTAKDLKAPHTQINKGYISIEKAFVNEATVVFDDNENKFKAYRDEQQKIKQAKIDAKNKALTDAVDQAKAEAEEANLKMAKSNLYNAIKYETINRNIVEKASDAVIHSNKRSIEVLRSDITELDYSAILQGRDDSILDEEVRAELREFFVSSRAKAITLINDRLKAIEIEAQAAIEAPSIIETSNEIDAKIPPAVPPVPGKPLPIEPMETLTDAEFINHINDKGLILLLMTQSRIERFPASSPQLYDLRNKLLTFKNHK